MEDMILEFFPNVSINKISVLQDLACDTIKNYLNDESLTDEFMVENYRSAIFVLIHNALKYEDMKGLKVLQQGNKRIEYGQTTYNKYGLLDLTDEVKSLLPASKITLMG